MINPTEVAVEAPVSFDWSMAALIGIGVAFVGAYAWLAISGSAFMS